MVDRYKVVVGNVTATAHGAAHPEGEYVLWRDYEALRDEVDAHKRSRQLDANEARSREMEFRAEVERLKADIRDARGLMRGMIDAKDGRVARFLIERAERFIQRTAGPTPAALVGRMDLKRFEKAPCYICGYNGPNYYQAEVHECAGLYHEQTNEMP